MVWAFKPKKILTWQLFRDKLYLRSLETKFYVHIQNPHSQLFRDFFNKKKFEAGWYFFKMSKTISNEYIEVHKPLERLYINFINYEKLSIDMKQLK